MKKENIENRCISIIYTFIWIIRKWGYIKNRCIYMFIIKMSNRIQPSYYHLIHKYSYLQLKSKKVSAPIS